MGALAAAHAAWVVAGRAGAHQSERPAWGQIWQQMGAGQTSVERAGVRSSVAQDVGPDLRCLGVSPVAGLKDVRTHGFPEQE